MMDEELSFEDRLERAKIKWDQLDDDCFRYWYIQNWIPSDGLSVIYGPPNVGKTFIALDLAIHMTAGKPWFENSVSRTKVFYLALEGGEGIRDRLRALNAAKKDIFMEATKDFEISVGQFIDFGSNEEVSDFAKFLYNNHFYVLFIDTLTLALGGDDDATASGMGKFLRALQKLNIGCMFSVVLIHHTGKDSSKGPRGHSSLPAAADTIIKVSKHNEVSEAIVTKQRDGKIGSKIRFKLKEVTINQENVDMYNQAPITSCVVEAIAAEEKITKSTEPSGKAFIALNALHKSIEMSGELCDRPDLPNDRKVVSKETWSKQCKTDGLCSPDAQEHSFQRALKRALESLEAKELVATNVGYIWPL